MLTRVAVVTVFVALAACASAAKGKHCAPIDPELYQDYGGLYDECTVDQRARLISQPRLEYPYQAPRGVSCLIGELRFIVDTLGKPIQRTVEVTRANDEKFIEVMLSTLQQVRFTPGKVRDRSVYQIARWEARRPSSTLLPVATTTQRNPTSSNSSC